MVLNAVTAQKVQCYQYRIATCSSMQQVAAANNVQSQRCASAALYININMQQRQIMAGNCSAAMALGYHCILAESYNVSVSPFYYAILSGCIAKSK